MQEVSKNSRSQLGKSSKHTHTHTQKLSPVLPYSCTFRYLTGLRLFTVNSQTKLSQFCCFRVPLGGGGTLYNGQYGEALWVISIKFLLVISLLCKIEWSRELWTWSHKMNLLDIKSNSSHYFCKKWKGATNENLNFDLRV